MLICVLFIYELEEELCVWTLSSGGVGSCEGIEVLCDSVRDKTSCESKEVMTSEDDLRRGCSWDETLKECKKNECWNRSLNECLLGEDGCWLIDGSCLNVGECSNMDERGNCRSGCKRSEDEMSSSCVVDECGKYSVSKCGETVGCAVANNSCVSSEHVESDECNDIIDMSDCLKKNDCDIFAGYVCGKRVDFNEICSVVGEDVCLQTSNCKWDSRNGCVFIAEDDEVEKSNNSSSISWSLIAFIGLLD
jgi:hypothetical protein